MEKQTRQERQDGRNSEDLRPIRINTEVNKQAEGAVLIEVGDTRVLCTASLEEKVPPFLSGTQKGWVTAEYGMLPRATSTRTPREAARGRLSGRTMEIQRLVGRSLRAVVDLKKLGSRTIWLDCDVLQADGGTRTASITGAYVALTMAISKLIADGTLSQSPLKDLVAATSIGIVGGHILLDLNYGEDSAADVDMNVVMTGSGRLVEVQGTSEHETFTEAELVQMLKISREGIKEINHLQRDAIKRSADMKMLLESA